MKTINLEIFAENDDFYAEMDLFMCTRSNEYKIIKKRILSLNNILDTEESRDLKIDYFLGNDLNGKYHFDNLIGEIYSSKMIDVISLYGVSHGIKSIVISDLKYSAEVKILDTLDGKKIQMLPEENLVLRPVYGIPWINSSFTDTPEMRNVQIMTFNIDLKIEKKQYDTN